MTCDCALLLVATVALQQILAHLVYRYDTATAFTLYIGFAMGMVKPTVFPKQVPQVWVR